MDELDIEYNRMCDEVWKEQNGTFMFDDGTGDPYLGLRQQFFNPETTDGFDDDTDPDDVVIFGED